MNRKEQKIRHLGFILLRTGSMLMSNGANTSRIRMIVDRIAGTFGCDADLFITHRSLTLSISDKDHEHSFSSLKRTSPHGVNFRIVSGISRMSWNMKARNWSLAQIDKELSRLSSLPRYPQYILLPLIGLLGASLCGLTGGSLLAMIVCSFATFIGFCIRQGMHKRNFNGYLCVLVAAIMSAMFAGLFCKLYPGEGFESALAASVLYLVPGVPLINACTDLIDGNVLNGMLRAVHGLIIAFMIALGLVCSLTVYQI